MKVPLAQIAHGRSGDKGGHANVAVIAYTPAGFAWLQNHLSAEVVAAYFAPLGPSRVERFEAPNLLAVNFLLRDVLAGGASRSLRSDTQGKTLALALLRLEIEVPEAHQELLRGATPQERAVSELVLYANEGPAAILTLNRPDRRNALSRELIAALDAAVGRAEADSRARIVVLTGSGSSFCAGMDLAELQESLTGPATPPPPGGVPNETPVWEDALRLGRLYQRIYELQKPSIAAVNGAAVAGGAGLVSVCDLALAAPGAKFGYPEVRRGLVAAMVLPHLLRHAGERLARYLLLTGELIDAEEAARAGLVNAVAPAGDLLPRALAWAGSLAEGGPEALARTKALLREFSHQSASVEQEARASAAPRLGEECRQGLEAFFARRPAPWAPAHG